LFLIGINHRWEVGRKYDSKESLVLMDCIEQNVHIMKQRISYTIVIITFLLQLLVSPIVVAFAIPPGVVVSSDSHCYSSTIKGNNIGIRRIAELRGGTKHTSSSLSLSLLQRSPNKKENRMCLQTKQTQQHPNDAADNHRNRMSTVTGILSTRNDVNETPIENDNGTSNSRNDATSSSVVNGQYNNTTITNNHNTKNKKTKKNLPSTWMIMNHTTRISGGGGGSSTTTTRTSTRATTISSYYIARIRQYKSNIQNNPRIKACVYMSISMSLHYSGYEFVRNVALSLFTSDIGYPHPMAFPFVNALVSPLSILLLYIYSQQLDLYGPRHTLRNFTKYCIVFILISSLLLWQCSLLTASTSSFAVSYKVVIQQLQRLLIGLMFLFNNCYVFMISSQQWSFTDSIVTPLEGAQWFGALTGICSLLCTVTAGMIPYILPHFGLIGMYSITALTLYGTLVCGDRAYQIAQENGFDPALQQKEKKLPKQQLAPSNTNTTNTSSNTSSKNRISDAMVLFQRVPTLRALLLEGISFQSLGTILNVAMIRALQLQIPNDILRSIYIGKFYACISFVSAIVQFILLPIGMKRFEPKYLWRIIPIIPLCISFYQILPGASISLQMVAFALFITKILDYSLRVVIYNMAYQPLDFDSRFVGKEIINVFGGRVGRSGMSLLLSGLTAFNLMSSSIRPLSFFAFTTSTIWTISTYWLSTLIPNKADAQQIVVERRRIAEQGYQESKNKNKSQDIK
jgi:ATP/ADP translocase